MANTVSPASTQSGTREAMEALAQQAREEAAKRHATDARVINRKGSVLRKPYRLVRGTHSEVNPDYVQGEQATGGLSHVLRQVGEICYLTDEQYRVFKNKFEPASEQTPEVSTDSSKAQ